jgi:alpha-1,2-mannosyltransferase
MSGLRSAVADIAPFVYLIVIPALLWTGLFADAIRHHGLAFDFDRHSYPLARQFIEGHTPATAYPPLTTLFFVPFAYLPIGVADVLVTVLMVVCAAGTLRLLGVTDWRCYGAAMFWLPVWATVQTGNVSLLLTVAVAGAWRMRSRSAVTGGLVAVAIAAKLFLWPLALWLVATRRSRAVSIMVGIGLVASAAAWTVIGFDTVTKFPSLVRGNIVDNGEKPYTIVAVVEQLGASAVIAYGVCWILGAAVLVVASRLGWRGNDAAAMSLFIGAAVLLSPIVWSHYLVLLLVPVALTSPRFSLLWLAPLPLWLCPPIDAAMPQKLLLLVTGAIIIGVCARTLTRGPRARSGRLQTA